MHKHFFAAMLGKRAVDGIGVTVKRAIRKKVLSKKSITSPAKDLTTATNNLKINVILLTEIEKLEINSLGLSEFFEKTKKKKTCLNAITFKS